MKLKKTRGFTLVEMLVAIALTGIIAAGIGVAMYNAYQNHLFNERMREDEYNARFALLYISREAHRGVTEVDVGPNELILTMIDGDAVIRYYLDSDNMLRREISEGDTPTPFRPVELDSFEAEELEQVRDGGKRLRLIIQCRNGLELETTISLSRIPQAAQDEEEL